MKFLELIYPGLGWTVGLMLVGLAITQVDLYRKFGLKRSWHLAIFCFCSALFAFNVGIVYSQAFSVEFTRHFAVDLQFVLYVGLYHYLRAMNYFVAIPRLVRKIYLWGVMIAGLVTLIPSASLIFFGKDIYFGPELLETGNFFVDSYTNRLGGPGLLSSVLLTTLGALNIFVTSVMLYRLRKTSGDIFLMAGLIFTLVASFFDTFLIAFTLQFYVPLLFLSNIFEALRMSFLASLESVVRYEEKSTSIEKQPPVEVSSLDEESLSVLTDRLKRLVENDKIYLNPQLSLESVAHTMRIPSYQLSQVVRFGMNRGFSELINHHRVLEAQKELLDPKNKEKTILDIAFSSGFNSKSTFNNVFKKTTSMTPTEFKKKGK